MSQITFSDFDQLVTSYCLLLKLSNDITLISELLEHSETSSPAIAIIIITTSKAVYSLFDFFSLSIGLYLFRKLKIKHEKIIGKTDNIPNRTANTSRHRY